MLLLRSDEAISQTECDHSAEWNGCVVGNGLLVEVSFWNCSWLQKEPPVAYGGSEEIVTGRAKTCYQSSVSAEAAGRGICLFGMLESFLLSCVSL